MDGPRPVDGPRTTRHPLNARTTPAGGGGGGRREWLDLGGRTEPNEAYRSRQEGTFPVIEGGNLRTWACPAGDTALSFASVRPS